MIILNLRPVKPDPDPNLSLTGGVPGFIKKIEAVLKSTILQLSFALNLLVKFALITIEIRLVTRKQHYKRLTNHGELL